MIVYSPFGILIHREIELKRLSQAALAKALVCSPAYINQVMTGLRQNGLPRSISPKLVNRISDVLGLKHVVRVELHRAAAEESGYILD